MRNLKDITLKDADRRAIERATTILRSEFEVEQVILFGSKARGDDVPGSDIDLLVLTRGAVSYRDKERMTRALVELEVELAVVLSLLVLPMQKWTSAIYRVNPIRSEIEANGVAA